MSMKVQPFVQNEQQMSKEMKNVYNLKMFIWTTANGLGLLPFRVDKETHQLSFKWLSTQTLLSLLRLLFFNSLLTILPVVLFYLHYKEEWGSDKPGWMKRGNGTISTAEVTFYGEYLCNYSYYILSQLQNVRANLKLVV